MEPYALTIHEARQLLDKKEISSVELTRSVFDRIERVEPKVGAYITLARESALSAAAAADTRLQSGGIAPLTGIPLAVKDLICTTGLRTTCASRMLETFMPPMTPR